MRIYIMQRGKDISDALREFIIHLERVTRPFPNNLEFKILPLRVKTFKRVHVQ